MTFCLPKKYSTAFQQAIRPDAKGNQGPLHPSALRRMSSEERRAAFAKVIGEDNAKEVNIKFEEQLLLKDQQKAMVNFINDMQGLNPTAKKDMVDQVLAMKRILSPKFARRFLEDLAAKKLGADITHVEAEQVFSLAEQANKAKQEALADPKNVEKRDEFGYQMTLLNDKVNELKGNSTTAWEKALNILNLPKGIQATWDFSASLVQASSQMHRKVFWESLVQMFKDGWDKETFNRSRGAILAHPRYVDAKRDGLKISGINDKLTPNEEYMGTNLIEQANGWLKKQSNKAVQLVAPGSKIAIPNVTAGADRAFAGFLNNLRFQTYVDLMEAAELRGENLNVTSKYGRDIATNINTFTGSGNIGWHDKGAMAVPVLNLVTWTIRKAAGDITFLTPLPFIKASSTARAYALKTYAGYAATTATVYGVARLLLGPDAVPTDPSDTHFGWIKIGNTWHNPTLGSKATLFRLYWRLAAGRVINGAGVESRYARSLSDMATGNEPEITDKRTTRSDLIMKFARGKLAPNASLLADALTERDFAGNDVGWNKETLMREARDRLIPMSMSSMLDVMQNDPDNTPGKIVSLMAVFGSSVYANTPQSRQGLTVWGDGVSDRHDPDSPDLNKALLDINTNMKFPPKKIKGATLTDKQYHDYILIQGQSAKEQLTQAIESGEWDKSTDEEKREGWKNALRIARRAAHDAIDMNSQYNNDGEDNPTFDQSVENHDKDVSPAR